MQEFIVFVSKNPLLSLAWVGLLAAVVFLTLKIRLSKVKLITRAEAVLLMNKEDAVVVDVRAHDAFHNAHIVDSHNITPSEIKDNNLGQLDKHKQQPIIVIDANGQMAREPAELLVKAGFERVYALKGGIMGWSDENLPLVRKKK